MAELINLSAARTCQFGERLLSTALIKLPHMAYINTNRLPLISERYPQGYDMIIIPGME